MESDGQFDRVVKIDVHTAVGENILYSVCQEISFRDYRETLKKL